jgi:hemolysin activation/secretion protein
MRKLLIWSAGALALGAGQGVVAQPPAPAAHFDIERYEVSGNTLIPDSRLHELLDPFTGKQRDLGDVQQALKALETAYRVAGYGTVQLELPEQDATGSVIRLNVIEVRLASVAVTGNKHFSEANVLRGLPALRSGETPNLRALSENVQLSNESRAKQVEVILAASQTPGTVDARVSVVDESPHHFGLTLDNTGTQASGRWRIGAFYQHENLFDRDQAASLAYTTSPDSPEGVRVNIFGVGYRVPLYAWGDSVDLLYGKSSSNTPSSTPSLGGALNLTGKGDVFALHFNHNFARSGETTSKLGVDYTYVDSRCTTVDGTPVSIAPPTPPIASCVPYTVAPLMARYASSTRSDSMLAGYYAGAAINIPSGTRYTNITGRTDRYSYLTAGNRDTRDDFVIVRGGADYLRGLASDWQVRMALNGQYAFDPTVSAQSFGLTGANAVRGFDERALVADSGAVVNAELYAPDLAAARGWQGSLRALLFVDAGYGSNRSPNAVVPGELSPASFGFGLRGAIGKVAILRLDVARVAHAAHAIGVANGDYKAHVLLTAAI